MKNGQSLLIDHLTLFGILHDDLLYQSPVLSHLRDQGKDTYRRIIADTLYSQGCSGCSSFTKAMQPIQDAIGQALADSDEAGREVFLAYLIKKRGYRPVPVVLYYVGRDGQAKKLLI